MFGLCGIKRDGRQSMVVLRDGKSISSGSVLFAPVLESPG